jgi:PhnB protein
MKLYTYVNYAGNCREAFRFYEQHLAGQITMMMTHGQGPNPNDGAPDWKDAILHARMTLGETELMGADIPAAQPMRSAYLTLLTGSIEEAERVYAALSEGGEIFTNARNFFRPPICAVTRSVWYVVDDPPRTSEDLESSGPFFTIPEYLNGRTMP